MGWVAVLAVLLAGCNTLFDLERTTLRENASCEEHALDQDEDGDGVSNGDDNCPGIYNSVQTDRDRDDVGDVCDPFAMLAGDHIVDATVFEHDFGCWVPDPSTRWSLVGGAARAAVGTPVTLMLKTAITNPMIELGFRFVDPMMYGILRVSIAYPNDIDTCEVVTYLDRNDLLTWIDSADTLTERVGPVEGMHRLALSRNAMRGLCSLDVVSVQTPQAVTSPSDQATITIRAEDTGIEIAYATVYSTN